MVEKMAKEEIVENFSPARSGTSNLLPILGEALGPRQEVSIKRRWTDKGLHWVSIGADAEGNQLAFVVRWIMRTGDGDFAVLQLPPGMWDLDEGPIPEALVRVKNFGTVRILTAGEFERLRDSLEEDRLSKGDLPAREFDPMFAELVSHVLGRMPERGSPAYKAQNPEGEGLTNVLYLGSEQLAPGQKARIRLRWQEAGYFSLALAADEAGRVSEFSLRWLFPVKKTHCAILNYPPSLQADSAERYDVVVKVADRDHLEAISEEDLRSVAQSCFEEMERAERSSPEAIIEALGPFASWAEIKDQVIKLS